MSPAKKGNPPFSIFQMPPHGTVELPPLEQAQELVYDAWEAPSRAKAVALAEKALKLSADCADAYTILASEKAKNIEEALEYYRKAVEAGKRAIGPKGFKEMKGHFWGFLETRPYMRAMHFFAEALWATGQIDEALEHFQEMLKLNPGDNQGIRYILMNKYLVLNDRKGAEQLEKSFKGDRSAEWLYALALFEFRASGDGAASAKKLLEALTSNPHVPAFLLGLKKLPKEPPEYIGMGDENEAVACVFQQLETWQKTPGALDWVKGKAASSFPPKITKPGRPRKTTK